MHWHFPSLRRETSCETGRAARHPTCKATAGVWNAPAKPVALTTPPAGHREPSGPLGSLGPKPSTRSSDSLQSQLLQTLGCPNGHEPAWCPQVSPLVFRPRQMSPTCTWGSHSPLSARQTPLLRRSLPRRSQGRTTRGVPPRCPPQLTTTCFLGHESVQSTAPLKPSALTLVAVMEHQEGIRGKGYPHSLGFPCQSLHVEASNLLLS